jgi:hypothetical protein
MSDGEKSALYLAGRILSAEPGIVVVDEPETHLHSLLAIRLWNALEDARPDMRFVYVTHDLNFAMSRRGARFVLSSPTDGLRAIDVDSNLPDDVAGELLGSASLSFYASRVVFCEGDAGSYDNELYNAWFSGQDTVVKSVGNSQRVMRCVDALNSSGIATSLQAIGIVDGDYHPDALKAALPKGVWVLKVHEVESLLSLPGVVAAVCAHTSQEFDEAAYLAAIKATTNEKQRHGIIIERWKARIEPNLTGLVSKVGKQQSPVDDLVAQLPDIFDHSKWSFSPADMLKEEKLRVEESMSTGSLAELLNIMPGKQVLPVAARTAGFSNVGSYVKLAVDALRGDKPDLKSLGSKLEEAFANQLPPRFAVALISGPIG